MRCHRRGAITQGDERSTWKDRKREGSETDSLLVTTGRELSHRCEGQERTITERPDFEVHLPASLPLLSRPPARLVSSQRHGVLAETGGRDREVRVRRDREDREKGRDGVVKGVGERVGR